MRRRSAIFAIVFSLCLAASGPSISAAKKTTSKQTSGSTSKTATKGGAPVKPSKPALVNAKVTTVDAKPAAASATTPPLSANCYTSLVIDATGLKLDKSMCAKVYRKCGTEVWGTLKDLTDEQYDLLQDRGMVSYVVTVDEAKRNQRAGAKPLIVKAVDTQGSKLRCDVVVSDEDGDLILAADRDGKFLNRFSVILVRNETPPAPPSPATDASSTREAADPPPSVH